MKKTILVIAIILLGMNFTSCTKESLENNTQATEGNTGHTKEKR